MARVSENSFWKSSCEDLMKRNVFGIFCFSAVLLLSVSCDVYSQHETTRRLKLYVGEIKGDEDIVKSVRDRLVDELAKRGVALSPSENESDAILRGIGVHRTGTHLMLRGRSTLSLVIRGNIQLSARDGRKLWNSDVSSTRWAISETGSFAEIAAGRTADVLRRISPQITAKP